MDQGRVQSRLGVTLVGAGEPRSETIEEALKLAPTLVAADGGANFALAAGYLPEAVIGDLDSVSDEVRARLPQAAFLRVEEQESTDFEKCLLRIDAPFVLAAGFEAGRVDHMLAVLSALAREVGPATLLIGARDVIFAAPRRLGLDLAPGTRLSLFPMAPVTGRSEGLLWPIDGLDFAPRGRVGTSNRVTGPVRLDFDAPGMLVILPRAALAAAISGLTG